MASRYWVGGGSSTNWSATGNTNWSATDGGAGNASVPTTTDDVFFTASSPSPSVISASITVMSVNCTGYTGTITHNASVNLTINTGTATSLLLSAGMTYTAAANTSVVIFTNTSGTADITSNGKRLGGLTINGVGGTTRLLDALRVDTAAASTITLTNGTFNANNFNVTATLFSSSNANTRTITMGSGTWTLGLLAAAASTVWTTATITGLTFNKNTANIVIKSNASSGVRTFGGGGLTYNGLTIDANSAKGIVVITGANTFSSLAIGAGNMIQWVAAATNTITAAPTIAGTSVLPVSFRSLTVGTAATISCPSGTFSMAWGALRDITGTGGASFVASNSLDDGGNTGIAISPPADAGTAAPTVAQIVAGVWDEPTAGNVTAGTFGEQLKTTLDAVKAKTDSLTFTVAGQVDGNIQYVNDVAVTGNGQAGTEWGP